jgi:hypothetical protein
MRKTYSVEKLKTIINNQILHSADTDVVAREALITTLEGILHDTGNYNGFQYLDGAEMEFSQFGNTVGINPVPYGTYGGEAHEVRFANTDRTRVKYF